jgi:outer membrane lipoprotein LolB
MAFNFFAGRNTFRGRRSSLALMAAGVVLVSGCATRPHEPSTSNATTSVTAQTSRAYHGRFAVQYNDQNGQQRNAYGNFSWQETGDTVTLQLLNPLGQTLAIVTSSPSSATLELPNRAPQTATNVSELMQNTLGFALPVEGLRYWLQPSPAPTSRARTLRRRMGGSRKSSRTAGRSTTWPTPTPPRAASSGSTSRAPNRRSTSSSCSTSNRPHVCRHPVNYAVASRPRS